MDRIESDRTGAVTFLPSNKNQLDEKISWIEKLIGNDLVFYWSKRIHHITLHR